MSIDELEDMLDEIFDRARTITIRRKDGLFVVRALDENDDLIAAAPHPGIGEATTRLLRRMSP